MLEPARASRIARTHFHAVSTDPRWRDGVRLVRDQAVFRERLGGRGREVAAEWWAHRREPIDANTLKHRTSQRPLPDSTNAPVSSQYPSYLPVSIQVPASRVP